MAEYTDFISSITDSFYVGDKKVDIFQPAVSGQLENYFEKYSFHYTPIQFGEMIDSVKKIKAVYVGDLDYTDMVFELTNNLYQTIQCKLEMRSAEYVLVSIAEWSEGEVIASSPFPYTNPPLAYKASPPDKLVNEVTFGGETLLTVRDTTAIEADVAAGKIFTKKDGTKGTGTVSAYTGSTIITPAKTAQTLLTAGKTVADNITVSGITAAVDSNITAENIKNSVNILGVTGNLIGGSGEMKVAMFSQPDKWEGTINEFFQQKVHDKIPAIADMYSVAYAEITFCSYCIPPDTEKHITIGGVSGNVVKLIFEYNGIPESLADINFIFNENYLNDQAATSGNIESYDEINILQYQGVSYTQSTVIIKYVLR